MYRIFSTVNYAIILCKISHILGLTMLKKFSVSNYRRFHQTLTFDLSASHYAFNTACIRQNMIKLALIYGENGTGKSNLGWALFDLVSHLTDNEANADYGKVNYLNALSNEKYATFKFEFAFTDQDNKLHSVTYTYQKDENKVLQSEQLIIDDQIMVDYVLGRPFTSQLNGAENLNKVLNPTQNLSAIKYIFNNTSLDTQNEYNYLFMKFVDFIQHILYFRSVFSGKDFMGYKAGGNDIEQDILVKGNLDNLERFLSEFGVNFKLVKVRQLNKAIIGIKIGDKILPFFDVVSTGTLSLTFFYYWWQSIQTDEIPLLFIDEFDCSYHFSLAEKIVEKLKQLPNTQVILTTHNTNLLSNDLVRPDCCFIINGEAIRSLNHSTNKEIREVHNLEKLYQAGHFN